MVNLHNRNIVCGIFNFRVFTRRFSMWIMCACPDRSKTYCSCLRGSRIHTVIGRGISGEYWSSRMSLDELHLPPLAKHYPSLCGCWLWFKQAVIGWPTISSTIWTSWGNSLSRLPQTDRPIAMHFRGSIIWTDGLALCAITLYCERRFQTAKMLFSISKKRIKLPHFVIWRYCQ